jgi:hypothetical protein
MKAYAVVWEPRASRELAEVRADLGPSWVVVPLGCVTDREARATDPEMLATDREMLASAPESAPPLAEGGAYAGPMRHRGVTRPLSLT